MKKILFISVASLLISFGSKASHFLGNDIRMEQISSNQYKIILRIASSPTSVTLNNSSVMILEENTHNLIATVSLSLDSTRTFSTLIGGTSLGFVVNYYSNTVNLANNANGYYVSSNHCCRTSVMNHAPNGGVVFSCENTNPAITGGNSNPKFIDYPDSLFLVVGINRQLDFSCTDLDGDSLVYSLITPFDNTTSGGSKPFNLLNYNAGFNLPNLLGPGASISINSNTGIINATALQIGQYIVAVKCEEYRNGVKIGQVVRDIIIPAINMTFPASIKDNLELMDATIFPNPNQGVFYISLNESGSVFNTSVRDVSGKLVYSKTNLTSGLQVNLSDLPKGLYFIELSNNNQTIVKKVVKH